MYTGRGYMALLNKRRRLKNSRRHRKAYLALGKRASAYRRRMINPHPVQKRVPKSCSMDGNSRKVYRDVIKTKAGQETAKRFKQFWKIPCPPSVKGIPGGPKTTIPLMGMGTTDKVVLSSGNKGEHGKRERTIKGNWNVASDKTGKHVLMLGKRPMSGGLKFVGYAPVTFYIPPADVERAGTHKKGFVWKHKHGEADGTKIPRNELEWPKVYADRDGKVDSSSNFVYGKTKHGKITTWMYH